MTTGIVDQEWFTKQKSYLQLTLNYNNSIVCFTSRQVLFQMLLVP